MTEIVFYKNGAGDILGFKSEGHSGYAKYGEDVVCAAISALVINTINSINELTEDKLNVDIDEEKCHIIAFFSAPSSLEAQLLIKSLALGLSNIKNDESAAEFIDVIFEEEMKCLE